MGVGLGSGGRQEQEREKLPGKEVTACLQKHFISLVGARRRDAALELCFKLCLPGGPRVFRAYLINSNQNWKDFLGGPMVRTLHVYCKGYGFHPWSENLRSHMLDGAAKRGKKEIQC